MKKNITKYIIIILLFTLICGCKNSNNENNLNPNNKETIKTENKEETIYNFPKLKNAVDNIIIKLNNKEPFENLTFSNFKKLGGIKYEVTYKIVNTELTMIYKDDVLIKISLKNPKEFGSTFSEKNFINQMLELTYLEEFDINENDFDNSSAIYSYQNYLELISGISVFPEVYTTDSKKLKIYFSNTQFNIEFYIEKI